MPFSLIYLELSTYEAGIAFLKVGVVDLSQFFNVSCNDEKYQCALIGFDHKVTLKTIKSGGGIMVKAM
jgi:hypothetical protein